MHIAMIGSRSSIHIVRWANSLYKKGFSITVFTMHDKKEDFVEGVTEIIMPFRNPYGYLLNIPFLYLKLRSLKPDLIHSFYAFGHSFLARMTGYNPHIVSVFGSDIYDDTEMNRFYKWIIKRNITSSDIVCSTSLVMRERIKEITNKSLEVQVTPFGVDTQKFNILEGYKDDYYELTLGTVKKLEHKYGIDTLIKTFALFVQKYPNLKTKLIIIGEGSKKEELVQLSRELNVFDKCEFVGFVKHNEVPKWLNKMDIFLALSRLDSESFGVSIIEASACELPVIVSDSGGLPEVVEDGKTGIVVPKENPRKAFEAIDHLYQNQAFAKEMGAKGRKRVIDMYNWKASIEQMEKVYKRIIR